MNIQNLNSPTFKRLEISYDAEPKLSKLDPYTIHDIRRHGISLENGTHFNLLLDKDLNPTIKDNSKLFSYYEMPYEVCPVYGKSSYLRLCTKEVTKNSNDENRKTDVDLCIKMKNALEVRRVYDKIARSDDIEKATILVNLLDRDAKRKDDEEFCLKNLNTKRKLVDNVLYLFGANM